ncbi:NUDIX hydrolase [Desulfovibrio litoralis]|uniref:NUDIX hydrolase n=1 Tax=Desulfovibrio litoralis TaxID=466107 RepID=UPI000A02C6FD|nr:NUDIX domain-containing protein [Desulfovibrio litoralis]
MPVDNNIKSLDYYIRMIQDDVLEQDVELIEVLDNSGKTLMIMPRSELVKQELFFKAVLILFINKNKKIYIHKRAKHKKPYAGMWTCSATGFVKAGESFEEAAFRELFEEIAISGVRLNLIAKHKAEKNTGNAALALYISEPSNFIPCFNTDEAEDGMFVDLEELNSLIVNFPELLTPALKWAYLCLNNKELDLKL